MVQRLGDYLNPVASGQNVTQYNAGGITQSPATDPAHFQKRAVGWQGFLEKLSSDPDMQMSLLSFGASLLQPRGVGQTQAGAIGQAAVKGLGTYRALQSQKEEDARKKQQLALQERQVGVAERGARAEEQRVGIARTAAETQAAAEAERNRIERAKLPSAEETAAKIDSERADAQYKRALAAAAGKANQAVGAQEHLAMSLADIWLAEKRYKPEEKATAQADAINWLLTLDRTAPTTAEYESQVRSRIKADPLDTEEQAAQKEDLIASMTQAYDVQRRAAMPRPRPGEVPLVPGREHAQELLQRWGNPAATAQPGAPAPLQLTPAAAEPPTQAPLQLEPTAPAAAPAVPAAQPTMIGSFVQSTVDKMKQAAAEYAQSAEERTRALQKRFGQAEAASPAAPTPAPATTPPAPAAPAVTPPAAPTAAAAPAPSQAQTLGDSYFSREMSKLQASGRANDPAIVEALKARTKNLVPGWVAP